MAVEATTAMAATAAQAPNPAGAASVDATATKRSRRPLTIEELCFSSAMSCFEGWLKMEPTIGPKSMQLVTKSITRSLEKTHSLKDVRENLAKSVEVWMWLTKVFAAALPSLSMRSTGPLDTLHDAYKSATPQESTALIIKNYQSLKDDLQLLIKLMHIARNLLVVSEPEIPQDLCAAVQFDQMLYQSIFLCMNATSKAYDGEMLEQSAKVKLTEITELFKKLLVTSLQQAHNWIAKNDRNKMSFWYAVLSDDNDEASMDGRISVVGDVRTDVVKVEVMNWIERNSRFCAKAQELLIQYEETLACRGNPPGALPRLHPLAWNWLPKGTVKARPDNVDDNTKITPEWKEDEPDKFEQDRAYGRVSREIDTWWLKVRDPNYEGWTVPMPSVEFAKTRTENCQSNYLNRYAHAYRTVDPEEDGSVHSAEGAAPPEGDIDQSAQDGQSYSQDYNEDLIEEEDIEDDDDDNESYDENPLNGLLTDIPNILDPKQIEALHMIVKSCILDNAGLALSRAGENLQKTRCRMLLALDCGRSLLREILLFIAVWDKSEQSLIFQLTTQIIEAIHHSALIPHAWSCLRIPKDIISPAQAVLLKLINNIFRARSVDPPAPESKEYMRDIKLAHFLFTQFRSRVVPECASLMHFQAMIRKGECDPGYFPLPWWDMERAKDGLQQFLDVLTSASELVEIRKWLIQWEAVYDLLVLLKGIDAGVPKKPLVDPARQQPQPVDHDYDAEDQAPMQHPPPQEGPAHTYPWAGVKGQILHILAGLLQPPPGRSSPGNPIVQEQVMRHDGIIPILNCTIYDDHNKYARERVQICLKWLLDGCPAANDAVRNLMAATPNPNLRAAGDPLPRTARVDGIDGEVKVRVADPAGSKMPGTGGSASPSTGASISPREQTDKHPAAGARTADIPPPAPPASPSATPSPLISTSSFHKHGETCDCAKDVPPPPSYSGTLPSLARLMNPTTTFSNLSNQLREAVAARNAASAGFGSASGNEANTLPPINTSTLLKALAGSADGEQRTSRSEEMLRDIISLADEAARLALGSGVPPDMCNAGELISLADKTARFALTSNRVTGPEVEELLSLAQRTAKLGLAMGSKASQPPPDEPETGDGEKKDNKAKEDETKDDETDDETDEEEYTRENA